MILLVGSQKGGCGKSTLATNLCAYYASKGDDVILVDADRQGTSSRWAQDRAEMHPELPKVHCVQKYDNINPTILDLCKRYEHVIVDAAGRDSRELRTGMISADILIIPFRPSQPDLDTLPKLWEIIAEAQDINETLVPTAVLVMAPTNPKVKEVEEARQCFLDFPGIKLLPSEIKDRKIYRDAMSEGQGVIEANNLDAKNEVKNIAEVLF